MTLFIDDGEPGTWADAIAHSPSMRISEFSPCLKTGDDLPRLEVRKDTSGNQSDGLGFFHTPINTNQEDQDNAA